MSKNDESGCLDALGVWELIQGLRLAQPHFLLEFEAPRVGMFKTHFLREFEAHKNGADAFPKSYISKFSRAVHTERVHIKLIGFE